MYSQVSYQHCYLTVTVHIITYTMCDTFVLAKLYNSPSGTPPLVVIRLQVTITVVTAWKHVSI